MKQAILFATVASIFTIISGYLLNKEGIIANVISIFMMIGCFLTLCVGADAVRNNSSNILDDFEIEKYRVYCIKQKDEEWVMDCFFSSYKEAENYCIQKDFFHWKIEKESQQ
jgi:hypothetical protein